MTSIIDDKWVKLYVENLVQCDIDLLKTWRRSYIRTLVLMDKAIEEKEDKQK